MNAKHENADFTVNVTDQKSHSIMFDWIYKGGREYRVFKVEKRYGNNSWDLVYWGKKNSLTVRSLEMDLCFTFRVAAMQVCCYHIVLGDSRLSTKIFFAAN